MVHSGKTVETKLMALRGEELSIGWYTHTLGFYTNIKENELELVHVISTKYYWKIESKVHKSMYKKIPFCRNIKTKPQKSKTKANKQLSVSVYVLVE